MEYRSVEKKDINPFVITLYEPEANTPVLQYSEIRWN